MHFDLPPIDQQAERLIELGVHEMAGLSAGDVREAATGHGDVGLLTVHEKLAPASVLTPLLELENKRGFIVVDMADVDLFAPHRAGNAARKLITSAQWSRPRGSPGQLEPGRSIARNRRRRPYAADAYRRHPLAVAAPRHSRTRKVFHDHRLPTAQT